MNTNNYRLLFYKIFILSFVLFSCRKELPKVKDYLSENAQFTTTVYSPVLGRTTFFDNNFNTDNSNLPINFKIANIRRSNGDAAPELEEIFPVQVWDSTYTGNEKTLDEIKAKRSIQYRRLFDLWEHSGQFVMWAPAKSSFIRCQPDPGYLFDVELNSSGGTRYIYNLQLMPYRDRAYEPSRQDAITGNITDPSISPTVIQNMYGVKSKSYMGYGDVDVSFYKLSDVGSTLIFKFVDSIYNPIDPHKFATTDWNSVVHGQLRSINTDSVIYDILYPIPLMNRKTKYTNSDGSRASVRFTYNRIGFGHTREFSTLGMDFSIYETGTWVIVFRFKKDYPKFEDE